ncbi:MAG: hypothetical protein J4F46_10475, partial [Dehalococcoidia bacterium]|nr:hypothetical protein [Dehalococcoidia bacterium]
MAGGDRFTYVNTEKDWSGTDIAVSSGSGTACAATTTATTVYTPQGSSVSVASNAITDGTWTAQLEIIEKNSGINKLLISALPIISVVGVFGVVFMWYRGRHGSMMGGM